ncbi:MAG TPA: 3-dehydroquinate synthase family protein [Acidimicrobiales bacterium]|nr:3-dehydroquinate synthase family protein [Acidimicrobiales bacterium]
MIRVPVPLAERSYDIVVGRGVTAELPRLISPSVRRVAVVTQEPVGVHPETGRPQETFLVPDGEEAKTMAVAEDLCRRMAAAGFGRADAVVGVGGGSVTDLAGFVASVFVRGVPVFHVATTLLAQVDAAIGGKTGVNLAEGKNLVGTFWQPSGVICDTAHLDTLPAEQLASGRGEMAKYAFLGVKDLLDLPVDDQVAACAACKVEVVAEDERESGRRALLNYGHTLGHALEAAGGFRLLHGQAVAIGLVFAARLARELGRIDTARVEEHERVVSAFDLSGALPPGARADQLIGFMARDKKASGGLTFVLDGPAGLEVVADVDRGAVTAVLGQMGAG